MSRNLLNVAVSRAREKLIIVGSRELFDEVEIYRRPRIVLNAGKWATM